MSELPRTKWDYIYYAMIAGTILSFALALLGFVGEQLGWWNDIGEAFMQLGTAAGVVLGATTVVVGSSRTQVEATRETVEATKTAIESTNDGVESTREAVEANGETLASVDREMTQQTEVLGDIRDRL